MRHSDDGLKALGKPGERLFMVSESMMLIGVLGFLVFVPFLAARFLLEWSQASLPTAGHGAVLLVCFGVLFFWAWMISGDRGDRLSRTFYNKGIKWPFLFSLALLFFAVVCFASLSSTLSDLGYVQYEPAPPRATILRLMDLYGWHFMKAIPVLNLPDVLLWDEPFKRKDHLSGVLLLLFNVVVLVPVIGSFTIWNTIRKEHKQGDPAADRRTR
jgi:hypothetical protein